MKRILSAASAVAISASALLALPSLVVHAENPICQTAFTPDPAPVVYGDELWVYTGRDRDADNDFYYMTGWQCFSTKDMKNWTNHGCFMEDTEFSWCNANDAWASQCIERNGKYYFYFTTTNKGGGGRAVGVGVSDNPDGPFEDVLGKPLCGPNWDYIDPTVIIDDDGQAWLMFGNPKCYYVKLKEDMVTLDGEIKSFDMTEAAFGKGKNGTAYGEGPWIYKHDDLYYLVYAAFYQNDGGESICYSTGPTVTGPWTFRGKISPESNCFTTHGGIIDYKDHSYLFYHMNGLQGGGSFKRSAAVEEFTYGSDGSIPLCKVTKDGPDQIEAFNPYNKVEAETGSWFSGVKVEPAGNGSQAVGYIDNGDYIKVSGVDFGDEATGFTASVASPENGGKIELHLDAENGPIIGTVTVPVTGGWKEFREVETTVSGASGQHDLYLRFSGGSGSLFNFDWWQFTGSGAPDQPGQGNTQVTLPDENGYYFHDTFENGTNSWTGRGSASVSSVTTASYEGSKSLLCSGREASWNGAVKKLNSKYFKAGEEYSFSVNVMGVDETKIEDFYFTIQYEDADGEAKYDKIAKGSASGGQWIQLANTKYKIPDGAKNINIYVETDSDERNFYVDDAIGAVAGTKISGAGAGKIIALGDVNKDGRIDARDLSAAKRIVLKKSTANATMADVDKSGDVTAADVVWLQKYILGLVTEYPEPVAPPPSDYAYPSSVPYKEAPGNYFQKSNNPGKLINESYNGINGANKLNVYLPPNYDSSKQYNILYMMHGGGENENVLINDSDKFYINYLVENMINNGEVDPMIVVFSTFNKTEAADVWKEMRESIVPFVEGKYSTYAKSTSAADLEASRMHRAYGGFSMGGGSTWNVLINCNDYFAYYMPLSGHCWGGAQPILNVMGGKYKDSTYVFAATGTEDIAYGNMCNLINDLKKSDVIRYGCDFSKDNFYFLEASGKTHWWGFVKHYIYDGLPLFFREGQ